VCLLFDQLLSILDLALL
jgi:hypothetical protein